MGNSLTKATRRGASKLATRPRQCSITSRSVSVKPGSACTKATATSESRASGIPTTAAIRMAGWLMKTLHFHGVDVLADLHVLVAAEEPQVAVGAHDPHVAGVEPAVLVEGPLRPGPLVEPSVTM